MKKSILAFFLILLNITVSAQNVAHENKENWEKVKTYILNNWEAQQGKNNDLPKPYISVWPGLPFMFYWDTYFTNKGLQLTPLNYFAKNNTDNLLFAVDKFGYVGNAFVTDWGMNRSQPPYLSQMVRDIYEKDTQKDTAFLKSAYHTLLKEYEFWTSTKPNRIENHDTSIEGLQRFSHHATDKELIALYEQLSNRFNFERNVADSVKIKVAAPFAVEAGTGMDFTPRFEQRCPEFIALELNALLYTYEINFDWIETELNIHSDRNWLKKAKHRRKLINKYCWDKKRNMYVDYDFVNKRPSKVIAATAFQPLWAGLSSKCRAKKMVKNLSLLETPNGIASVAQNIEKYKYQWGRNSIWAPMQLIVVMGLDRYGYKTEAKRIATKYVNLVTANFMSPKPEQYADGNKIVSRKPGKTYEKYHLNGMLNDDEYPSSEMMGWTAGSFLWCLNYIQNN